MRISATHMIGMREELQSLQHHERESLGRHFFLKQAALALQSPDTIVGGSEVSISKRNPGSENDIANFISGYRIAFSSV